MIFLFIYFNFSTSEENKYLFTESIFKNILNPSNYNKFHIQVKYFSKTGKNNDYNKIIMVYKKAWLNSI
jgi:hypothetical protein